MTGASHVRARRAVRLAAVVAALLAADATVRALPARAAPDPGTRVGGKVVPSSAVVTLAPGERIETGAAPARVRLAGNGELRVGPGSIVSHQGVENGVESFYVVAGSAEGPITQATILGAAPGWARVDPGARASVRVSVPSGAAPATDRASFRAIEGGVQIEYFAVRASLPAGCEIDLTLGGAGPGSLSFAAAASNRAATVLARPSGDRSHVATVPAGVSGTLADGGRGTRFACRAAPRGSLIGLEIRNRAAAVRAGSVGPGASALLDGDAIRIEIAALGSGAIERLRAATAEFSTARREE